ncbi:MAG TPA: PBP1A family penicillin-binding protein [Firmicutes bacterium]|jgi:penicillin-binding protein 1A|nr:PBP1A family penicillin-binding protein [Bacillota bacterium]
MLRNRWSYCKRAMIVLIGLALFPMVFWTIQAAWIVATDRPEHISDAATLLDIKGRFIATVGTGRQAYIPYEDIPPHVISALITIEDERFFQHFGVDPRSILRSLWVNLRSGRRSQGASTITQQLARNLYLSREKTWTRKIKEAIFAVLLDLRYTKERILELYLNTVYFGEGAQGIEAAAYAYFGKTTREIDVAEGALLIGLLKAPSVLSPYKNATAAIQRRDLILRMMQEKGYITVDQMQTSLESEPHLAKRRGGLAPYFVDYVTTLLVNQFGHSTVYQGGLRVITTLDLDMQNAAQNAFGDMQGALVALNPRTGGITAMIGGRDYLESQFNRATHALRQPGSAFKPFVYAAALERGWTMNRTIIDHPGDFNGYKPENFNGEYWGQVTLKQALVRSLNTASVRLLQQVGVSHAVEMAQRLGINTLLLPEDRNLALVLGGLTQGVTPLAMAAAYAPFANDGIKNDPYAIEQVTDNEGRLLFHHQPHPRRVLSSEVAYLITNMLQAAVLNGTGSAANIGRPQAGKTGTTNDSLSAWFVGYTPQMVATVYIGHDTRKPLTGGGGSLAAPIWGKFAVAALKNQPVEDFVVPDTIQTGIPVDVFTGLLAGPACSLQEQDAFIVGTAPHNLAPCYWNAAAQPKPYRIGSGPVEASPDTTIVQLPQSPFGDPATYPLGQNPLPTSRIIPWELNQLIPLELDLPVPRPLEPITEPPASNDAAADPTPTTASYGEHSDPQTGEGNLAASPPVHLAPLNPQEVTPDNSPALESEADGSESHPDPIVGVGAESS